MAKGSLPADWIERFTDPYSVLGVSVTADDRRVLKRYRAVAKLLHPDALALLDSETQEFATQLFARIVNPAYQKLKQEKNRAESSALLRLQVRRLCRESAFQPQTDRASQLMTHPASAVDVFYEQAIAELAEMQYEPLTRFASITQEMNELNLVYLQLKMGDMVVREKRTGLVSATEAKPIKFTPAAQRKEVETESYARRHYRRAQEYAKKGNWAQTVQELKDAIKLEPDQSEFHALLGYAYLQQNLTGMATVYCRQALKLNPKQSLALKYADKVGVKATETPSAPDPSTTSKRGLFGVFRAKP
ncbi:MAG TPA: DnaJ domain-containing protein [Leptolyngbyaceae cyanobacterium M33_DOE_097]|uniref:J domain-containing protein n=1 Tax=Oscillatoriales cyanobacterium SpSt-418 TaxID=2282169 RepID=A0A7C3KG33_9CYAN|nr:DnaJ domain-containing protein [Leptolyngbyaceae cyanobacterium M33_DOE_097]